MRFRPGIRCSFTNIFRFQLLTKTSSPCTALAFDLCRKNEVLVASGDCSLRCYDSGIISVSFCQMPDNACCLPDNVKEKSCKNYYGGLPSHLVLPSIVMGHHGGYHLHPSSLPLIDIPVINPSYCHYSICYV